MTTFDEIRPVLLTVARENFWAFCCYMDWQFFRKKRRFLKEVAIAFQIIVDEYRNGNAVDVAVSMPPRSGKSYITSLFAAYWLGQFPELSVMRNCCTATLYQKFSYDTRNIIKSDRYREVFPAIELQPDKQNLDGWNLKTSKQVGYFGNGVGGTIIGFGANLAITDDLYKDMKDALSGTTDTFVKMWKESAHDSRKERNCPEIFVGTRWKKDDIIGTQIESKRLFKNIVIPALVNNKSLCEDVKSTEEYQDIKAVISPSVWNAEYMQDPMTIEGLLIPFDTVQFDDFSVVKDEHIAFRFAVGDPADTGGDKFSMPFIDVVQVDDRLLFLVRDVVHNTHGIEVNVSRITDKAKKNKTEQIIIEANGVGLSAVLLLKNQVKQFCKLTAFNSTVNKEVRILSHYEFVQANFVFDKQKYESDLEYKMFVKDLTEYTKEGDNKNKKDAIDVLCSAAAILKLKYQKILYG